jgi:hypothetical protein
MHVVVFVAEVADLDEEYGSLAIQLRDLALERFNCRRFIAVSENGEEVAVSWWESEDDIQRWRKHPLHVRAQQSGKVHWYSSYDVTVADVTRAYGHGTPSQGLDDRSTW